MPAIVFMVSEFVAVVNQTLEYAYGSVVISGELANFHISKGKWVYFDLKDELATVKFFGTVYQLPGPIKDGMTLNVRGVPRLHSSYGFSVNVSSIQLTGEGSIKKAAELLEAKLAREGLFDDARKRSLPYPPRRIGLITSGESAAYHDFIKIINACWGGLEITHADIQVQGEVAPVQIVAALERFNGLADPPEVLVITRGGGSAEDLSAFSDERVVRAVAASRISTLVAVGHEVDISLAELAADRRASTPSNAAELLVPDKKSVSDQLEPASRQLADAAIRNLDNTRSGNQLYLDQLDQLIGRKIELSTSYLAASRQLLAALDPGLPLARGYALVRTESGRVVRRGKDVAKNAIVSIELSDAKIGAKVERIDAKK